MSINDDLADSEYGDDFIEQEESLSDTTSEKFDPKADKRAHHNALERKRRDHIKDSFSNLKNAVPTFNGEKASRAQILKKATEYISHMRSKNNEHQKDIDQLKKENKILEEKIRALEQMKNEVSQTCCHCTPTKVANIDLYTNYGFGLVELDANNVQLMKSNDFQPDVSSNNIYHQLEPNNQFKASYNNQEVYSLVTTNNATLMPSYTFTPSSSNNDYDRFLE